MSQAQASEERARQSSTQRNAERAPEQQSMHRHSAGREHARLSSQLVAYTPANDCEGAGSPAPAWKRQRGSLDPKGAVQPAQLSVLQRIQARDPQEARPIASFGGSIGQRIMQSIALSHAHEEHAPAMPSPRQSSALEQRAPGSIAAGSGHAPVMCQHVLPGPSYGGSAFGRPILGSTTAPGGSRGYMPAADLPRCICSGFCEYFPRSDV